ncbi:Rpn family recombination-promoting nuclease/putative transposase [Lactobacillus sp. 0.1XD8-4]|uniref:Rpn family recombination-promoting nuclease/putative transposase n=1 Tax=uncultured Limosilactobacillus sp. TaxID=2837629 RepID=UPI00129D6B99|nr:Rpn family recombination-promoting nuclease/putative transposase [uncultured Limosilactobacillus sp.]MRN06442.1 Rpn family recombination-promoting nuclease/putative transposase [Lactobacillus sp. 0.1XD8-4]
MDNSREKLAASRWADAGLANDFIFNKTFLEQELTLELLRRIFPELHLANLSLINSQQEFKTTFDARTARFDIYVESGLDYRFDLEMQVRNYHDLFQRNLYYLASMVNDSMEHHQNYGEMGNSYVIFFCAFDPLGDGDQYSTFELRNLRHLQKRYGENIKVLFFDINSQKREVNPQLQAFLDFAAGRKVEEEDEFIVQLKKRIEYVKQNRKWRMEFMRRSIYEMDIENEKKWAVREGKEEGRKAGLKEGREKGLKEGRKEGREVGLQEGIKKGKENGILTLVKSLLSLKIDPQVIKQQLIENYHLDKDEAVKYLNKVK